MSKYTISDLATLSGIQANTIRMWERRYELFNPERTKTNIRKYSDEELTRLLNIALLKNRGLKISKLTNLSIEALNEKVKDYTLLQERYIDDDIEQLTLAMMNFDEKTIVHILKAGVEKHGFEKLYFEKVAAFFERIGVLWQTNTINPVHEHFVSQLLLRLLHQALIETPDNENDQCILFYLPEGEMHEISLLFYAVVAKRSGVKVVYLGPNLPVEWVLKHLEAIGTKAIFTAYVSSYSLKQVKKDLTLLNNYSPHIEVYVTGLQTRGIDKSLLQDINLIKSPEHFKKLIQLR